jgi:peptide-methionine (S)-S-oxide reductase
VVETVVGYCGGSTLNPTYKAISDYTEAIRVTFDPTVITFETLLTKFLNDHSPMPMAFTGLQYRSAIYYHTEEQRLIAERLRGEIRPSLSKNAALFEAADFYRAEEYHQHWIAKQMGSQMI